ncbi:MAG TPA: heme o synthase [Bryobacterales bacterium]|nr:heme o synthase [Bryobacterales bacterium]
MRPNSSAASAVLSPTQGSLLDYWELTKPSVVWLILMSTAVGCYMASSGSLPLLVIVHTMVGTALLAGGTGALNQWIEREADAKMRRTENRPLPAGRLRPLPAFWFGAFISAAGTIYLWAAVNPLAAFLGFLTLASYLGLYTPLKSRTPASTFVGAFPGAMPPLIGWVAVREAITIEGWVLFAMLFLWQFPHFYAIAWMYREDYQRAGIQMLPVVEPDGISTSRQIICYSLVLIPVSLAPAFLGMAGMFYAVSALLAGLVYLYFGILLARVKTGVQARRLLQASVFYLPLVYIFLMADKL